VLKIARPVVARIATLDLQWPRESGQQRLERYQPPPSRTERAYHNLIYYNQPAQGGHFAAWEQPQIFCEEVRAGLRPLRK